MLEISADSANPTVGVLSVAKRWTGLPLVTLRHELQEGRLQLVCPYPLHRNRLQEFIAMAKTLVDDGVHCEIRETWDSGVSRVMTLSQLENLEELDEEINAADCEETDAFVESSDSAS